MYCAACNLQFFIKDFTLKGSRCPMLLHCGHSLCESCINNNLKAGKIIICYLCGSASSLQSEEQTIEGFPPSMYLVGNLVAVQNSKLGRDKRLNSLLTDRYGNFNYTVKEQANTDVKHDLSGTACEECSLTALWYCENCKSNFCEICWCRVHASARSLMKHCKTAISNIETAKIGWRKCLEHESLDVEFYCQGCSTAACSYCVILHHQGENHCPITLKEKNLEIINIVKTAAEEAEKISKRMKQTLEKIKLTQNSMEGPRASFPDLELQITRNFSRMHGILQLEEERVLKKLQENCNQRGNCIRDLGQQLQGQIENLESLLGQYEMAVKRPQECDLTDLHRQLKEVQDLPCYLISRSPCNEEAKVAFDDGLFESLKNYCTVDLPPSQVFELRSGSSLPEGYAVEPLGLPDSERDTSPPEAKAERESSTSDIDTFSNCSSRDLGKGDVELSWPKSPNRGPVFQERKNYSVRVSYIKNPGEFYVTLISQRSRQQAIDKRASHLASSSTAIPATVTKDEIYLVKYNVDRKWYRARVMDVIPAKKLGAEECVLIYYVDYGNSETVPISRLRPIPADMLEPPLAIKCKLFDCVPKTGEWCTESTKTMEKILNNCTATMFVMKVHRHCLEVDLSVIYPDGQIGRDIVSVRDALLFLEFASFVRGSKIPRSANALKYLHQSLPSAGETFDVVVTYVNSPSDFYVQNTKQDLPYLYKLTTDLQKYYSENSEKGVIYNPTVGMPCAAHFTADQKWYRAKIIDVPGKKMVTVFYLDYGNKETIPWTEIRKLRECFLKWPGLALNCTLAGVLPVGKSWSAQARAYMEKCVMTMGCRVHVQGRPTSKQRLKVLLYREVNSAEVCVNSLFVDMGCALNTCTNFSWKAKGTIPENFTLKTISQCQGQSNNEEDEPIQTLTHSNTEKEQLKRSRTFQNRGRSKLSAKKLRELHESEKKSFSEVSSSEDAEKEVDEFDNIFKVKVEILSAESPSSIYVTFPTLMEEFKHLQSKLNEFYQNSSPVAGEWTAGKACAAYDSSKSCWYRASVISTLPNDQVKVFLKDVARVSSVPAIAVRELDPSLAKYASCAVKCHLADITPPGEQWPSISSEYLLSELEKFKEVYMTKRGRIDNKSLPIELWVQKIVPSGALEPSSKEWVTLNRLLVNQGLAIPLKQKVWCSNIPSNDEEHSDDVREESEQVAKDENPLDNEDMEEPGTPSGVFVPSFGSRWLPPEILRTSRFVGIPTYVDYNAYIHVYDSEQDENKLKTIGKTLLRVYGDSKPSPEDHFWSLGQLCIARYHADNSWHRGVIVHINEDATYEVLFVDYGNIETCHVADLRKGVKLHEIPILSRKLELQGISPTSEDGKWPLAVIDLLHSLVVDKACEINILKQSLDPSGPHIASLKVIEDDLEVGGFLVDQGFASVNCNLSQDLDTPESDEYSSNDFSPVSPKHERDSYFPLNIPDDCTGFFIQVTAVKSEIEFFGNMAHEESASPSLKTISREFEKLQKTLSDECHLQPLIEKFTKGLPCCCVHLRSNRWCRGEIDSFIKEENSVSVFYVDHGDKEFLNRDLVHECKSDWLSIPKMAVKFKLAGVKKCPDVSKSVYMKALTSCLNRSVLFAEIISREEEVLEVRLLTQRSGPLAYQEMIDQKLMTFTA